MTSTLPKTTASLPFANPMVVVGEQDFSIADDKFAVGDIAFAIGDLDIAVNDHLFTFREYDGRGR
jgi:hypothetical protein